MAENNRQLAAMLVPVLNDKLIVPGSVIAELIPFEAPEPVDGAPGWHLGEIHWRNQKVPVVSFEQANVGSSPVNTKRNHDRIAILNVITEGCELAFYGLALQGIPSSLRLMESDITPLKHADKDAGELVSCQIQTAGVRAVIPDLEKLEALLLTLPEPV